MSTPPFWLWPVSLLWLLLLCWLAFFQGLGDLGLMDKTEALFVEVGHQMLKRGDWVTPWWNGEKFFDYPIWGYWMVALSFRLFGVSEWAARLPVALAASVTVLAAFLLVLVWSPCREESHRRFGRAALAAGILATTPGWIGWGRTSTTDMFLASAITLALFGFLLSHRHPNHPALGPLGRIAFALFSAVAVLAKGPVGLLLPGLVVIPFLSLTRQWRRWLQPFSLLAMASLFLGVTLPWYVAAARSNGMDFIGGFLGFSNLQRFTSVLYDHPGPPWFYLPWLVLLVLPWSLFLPAAMARLRFWRTEGWRSGGSGFLSGPGEGGDQLPLFLLLWLVTIVGFFSIAATKLPGYILPALPAASLLVALYWRPLPPPIQGSPVGHAPPPGPSARWPLRLSTWITALLLAAMAVAASLAPGWVGTDPAYPDLGVALDRSGLPLLLAGLLALSSLATVVWLARFWPAGARWLWLPTLAGFLAVLALVIPPLGPLLDRERQLPLRELARLARQQALPGEPLWVVGTMRYSLLFYGGEIGKFVPGRFEMRDRLGKDPTGLGLTPASPSARLIGDRSALESLGIPGHAVQRLSRRGEQELWRVPRGSLIAR